ncbi:hypothetical protein L1049_016300 [Liquidambar formosana]|uniref:Uncharacterized protein n=1 Tax=Liquidambar formosana TaxID=63359 RepID=A0AAP0X6Q4_LIQFO
MYPGSIGAGGRDESIVILRVTILSPGLQLCKKLWVSLAVGLSRFNTTEVLS